MIKIASLWNNPNTGMSGPLEKYARIVVLPNRKTKDTQPDWNVFVAENNRGKDQAKTEPQGQLDTQDDDGIECPF